MKRILAAALLIISLAQFCAGAIPATPGSFISIGTARATGMGGAFTAVADDASAVFYNPAGLINAEYKEFSFMYTKYKNIIPYNYAALGIPINEMIAAGVGVIVDGDSLYNETTVGIAAATKLDWLQQVVKGICLGFNFKLQFAGYGTNIGGGTDKVTGHAGGLGVDFGALWAVTPELQLGMMVRDAISAIWWTTDNATTLEGAALTTDIGIKYGVKDLTLSATLSDLDVVKVGVEKLMFGIVDLRCGFSQALTMESNREYMLGFGIGHFQFGQKKEFSMNLDASYAFERLDNTLRIQTSFKYR